MSSQKQAWTVAVLPSVGERRKCVVSLEMHQREGRSEEMSSSFHLLNFERGNIHTLQLVLELTSPPLCQSLSHTYTRQYTSLTHSISAPKLAILFPHVPPDKHINAEAHSKIIQREKVLPGTFFISLIPSSLSACEKGNKTKKGCFNTALQPKGTFFSCNTLL